MASGSEVYELILRLARISANNPGLDLSDLKNRRSVASREADRLTQLIGTDRTFSLLEVVDILTPLVTEAASPRMLIGPDAMLEATSPGGRVRLIRDYLISILRGAEDEVLLLAPFWNVGTLLDLLESVPRAATRARLSLFLVETSRYKVSAESFMDRILSVWPSKSAQLYVHRASKSASQDYPHAKCMLVDGKHGYVGSANFTEAGMAGHFELGLPIEGQDCDVLAEDRVPRVL